MANTRREQKRLCEEVPRGRMEEGQKKRKMAAAPVTELAAPATELAALDVVLFGDYHFPESNWKGEIPLTPIAVSTTDPKPDVPIVRVFTVAMDHGSKYWEPQNSEDHCEAVNCGTWLPQVVANELHDRMVEEGRDSVASGNFIEEALNESGKSILVVDVKLLKRNYMAFYSMLVAKRMVGKFVIRKFFAEHVRPVSTMAIALKFIQHGTSLEEAQATTFEFLSNKLREDSVIDASGDMLMRIIQFVNWRRSDHPLIAGTVNIKIFLAAYMIVARPTHVFEAVGDLESKVLCASKPMLEAFHKTAEALSKGVPWHQVKRDTAKELPALLCEYLRAFKDWKLVDERKLAERLKKALRGLEDAERGLTTDEDPAFLEELVAQKQRLREKLAQIAGHKEVAAHDAERRAAAGSTAVATVLKVAGNSDADLPPGHLPGMTNEQLAHELILDQDFRLDEKSGMSEDKLVHTKIRETFERAFWESLVEDLSADPPSYSRVLSVMTEIKTGIESLAAGYPEARQIGEIVDVELITQQLSKDCLDCKGCQNLVDAIVGVLVSMHDRIKSTKRREETVNKWADVREKMVNAPENDNSAKASAICAALELVLDRVHAVRLDTANHKLKAIALFIREHGVDYEKSQFNKKLEKKIIGLERTRAWISHTVSELHQSKDTRVDASDLIQGKPGDFEAVLYIAIVDLIADYPNWGGTTRERAQKDEIPETMLLDLLRVQALNTHFHANVVSSIILVTVEQKVRELIRDAEVRTKLIGAVQEIVLKNPPKPAAPRHTIKLVMRELNDKVGADQRAALQSILEKNVGKNSAVYMPMTKIFKRAWYHLTKDKSIPPQCQVPEVAKVLIPEVERHSLSLAAVAVLNKKVHVKRYNEIIAKAAETIASSNKSV